MPCGADLPLRVATLFLTAPARPLRSLHFRRLSSFLSSPSPLHRAVASSLHHPHHPVPRRHRAALQPTILTQLRGIVAVAPATAAMKPKWTPADLPDLSGKVIVVTGSNIGLGQEIAKQLAIAKAKVIMACRNTQKAETAREAILSDVPAAELIVMKLDVSTSASVQAFASEFLAAYDRLDTLMCNAGVMALQERQTSADGHELQFATNHLGHYELVGRLLPLLAQTSGSRVVTQSSSANWFGEFRWDDLNALEKYSRWDQYSMTKLSNVVFANALNRRLEASGLESPRAWSVHPGLVIGQLQQVSAGDSKVEKIIYRVSSAFAGSYQTGALPAVYACGATEAEVGEFYGPNGIMRGVLAGNHPAVVAPNKLASDEETGDKLWAASEEMTGFKYDLTAAKQ